MNKQEQEFLDSIKNKIKKYKIEITLKEALSKAQNKFIQTKYNTGKTELVDIGVEYFLCKIDRKSVV